VAAQIFFLGAKKVVNIIPVDKNNKVIITIYFIRPILIPLLPIQTLTLGLVLS